MKIVRLTYSLSPNINQISSLTYSAVCNASPLTEFSMPLRDLTIEVLLATLGSFCATRMQQASQGGKHNLLLRHAGTVRRWYGTGTGTSRVLQGSHRESEEYSLSLVDDRHTNKSNDVDAYIRYVVRYSTVLRYRYRYRQNSSADERREVS